jgi:hypothetical protein
MGRLREELLDPWGGVIAGVAGGLAWAVVAPVGAVAVPLGLGVAAVVYGVKVGASLLGQRSEPVEPEPAVADVPLRRPRRGGPAEQWLVRAEHAERSLAELAATPGHAVARAQLGPVRDGAADAVATLRRLAGQVTAVEDAMDRVPVGRLEAERLRLVDAVAAARGERLRAERQRSLDSVTEQLAVAGRLADARDTLLARMQATVFTVEGLLARSAEVLAMSASGGVDRSADRLADLSADLDGLRAGLAEAEEVSRRVLDG